MKLTRRRKGLIKIGLLTMVMTLTLVGCKSNKEPIAKVGSEIIGKDELFDKMYSRNGEAVLQELISDKIIELEAKELGIKVEKADIDKELETIVEESGGEEMLEQNLANFGMTLDDLKSNIKQNYLLEGIFEKEFDVSEEEYREYFEENIAMYGEEEQVKASHILVDDEDFANELYEKIQAGEDFAELAKEHSTDPGSGANGGDLGYFPRGVMVPEFEEAAFNGEIDEVTKPVKSVHGYHIIKIVDKKDAVDPVYEDVRDKVRSQLLQAKGAEKFQEWFQQKSIKYNVEILK